MPAWRNFGRLKTKSSPPDECPDEWQVGDIVYFAELGEELEITATCCGLNDDTAEVARLNGGGRYSCGVDRTELQWVRRP